MADKKKRNADAASGKAPRAGRGKRTQKTGKTSGGGDPAAAAAKERVRKETANASKNVVGRADRGGRKNPRGKLKLMFFGGVGEIGKNMTALEYDDTIIVVDAGMAFPDNEINPGIDCVIPDYTYFNENRSKVKAVFLTHATVKTYPTARVYKWVRSKSNS